MTHDEIDEAEYRILERKALIGYLIDRAGQYTNDSGYVAFIEEIMKDIAESRHVVCYEAGEYDDLLERIERILRLRK